MAYEKFKLVYGAENKDIKGSLNGIPTKEDPTIVTLQNYNAKLVYEKGEELKASLTGIPAEGDRVIGTRKELEGIEVGEAAKAKAEVKTEEVKVEESTKTEEPAVASAKATKKVVKK